MIDLLDTATRLLSRQLCTEQELRKQLEKIFPDSPCLKTDMNATIENLQRLNLINDCRIAENLAQRHADKGNRFIRQSLKQKGICNEIIEEALANLGDEYLRALDEARQKTPCCSKAKLSQFLNHQNFSCRTIEAVIQQLNEEDAFALEIKQGVKCQNGI